MSMSLRDQLLQAGLVSEKQVRDAEREEQRQQQRQRQQPKHERAQGSKNARPQRPTTPHPHAQPKHADSQRSQPQQPQAERLQAERAQAERRQGHGPSQGTAPTPARLSADVASRIAQSAKVARDQALSRRQQEKAHKKALHAQIKQLIEQNRLPLDPSDEGYNFVDGTKIRRIPVSAALRGPLNRGEVLIVRHEARYDLVPAAIAARIRERDDSAVIAAAPPSAAAADDAYGEFSVPDDLIW